MRIPSATQSWVKVTSHLPLHPRRVLHMKVFERGHFTAMLARSPETTEFSAGVWKNALTPLHVILNQPNFWPSICICLTCFLTYKLAWKHAFKTQNRLFGAIRKLNQPQNLPTKQVDGGWVQFLEPRLRVLFVLLLLLFIGKSALHLLEKTLRFPATTAIQHVISTTCFTLYGGYFFDALKGKLLPLVWPDLQSDKRKAFIYNRSTSFLLWFFIALGVLQIVSDALNVPIASTLAFGGAGGIVFGLASRGILENFFAGLVLLLSEPFVPGDMITFQYAGQDVVGRVERVGWYQTRIRGRDTRPTYIPNNVFVLNAVTNMDRITHRKFEQTFYLPYKNATGISPVLEDIKSTLKLLPKVDILSPFYVYVTAYTERGLEVKLLLYFATKALDEYMSLQQRVLLEVNRILTAHEMCPSYLKLELDMPATRIGESIVDGIYKASGIRSNPPPPAAPSSHHNSDVDHQNIKKKKRGGGRKLQLKPAVTDPA